MSDSATLSNAPVTPDDARPSVAGPPGVTAAARPRARRRVRTRFWLLFMAAFVVSLTLYPPPWYAALRAFLVWEAARQGCNMRIDAMEGGPFDTIHLYGISCWPSSSPPSPADDAGLHIAQAEITPAWTLPWSQRASPSWVQKITLDGVRGRWDLSTTGRRSMAPPPVHVIRLGALTPRLVPDSFLVRADDATLRRGRYHLRMRSMWLSGSRDDEGEFLARAVEVGGPGFDATLPNQRGRTVWQGTRLTLSDLDLGHGVRLVRATLDGSRLLRRRLDWNADLRALGGTVRGQGAVNFARERLALEVGGSLQAVTLGPLARLLEITGPADGRVEQATFSFRGDPENWPAADLWLAGRATDFRWGERRWESLEMQAVVTNRRVQVHRLELRQSRNRLSLDVECSLPPDPQAAAEPGRWWQAGFACNVDAQLDDLHELARLFGSPAPDIAGRMSVNGHLGARPGTQGYDGYLNVEGSNLAFRGAPLEFLRSTLIFRGEELDVADLQATRGGDYLTGRGSMHIAGPPQFQALGRVSVENLGVYAPAYRGLLPWAEDNAAPIRSLMAGVRLEGSTLHLDQCHGEQAGNTFEIGGSVDMTAAGSPVLDLSLAGEEPPRMADPADADAAWRAGVSYKLAAHGPLAAGPTLSGDVQLVHGHFDAPLASGVPNLGPIINPDAPSMAAFSPSESVSAASPLPPSTLALMQPLLRRLPEAWRDWPLDLHVISAEPFPSGKMGIVGQVALTLDVTGTGSRPSLGGKLAFHSAAGAARESGTWYFSPGEPDNPTASITTLMDAAQRGTFFYGPLAQLRAISWKLEPTGIELTPQSAEGPPRLLEEAEPASIWMTALPAAPPQILFDL